VLLVNLLMIGLVMWPSFQQQLRPHLPKVFHRFYYAVAMTHTLVGIAAETLGLYIVVVAGTNLLPQWLCLTHWKRLDAGGGRALVDRSGKRSGDLLRMVCGTLRVVPAKNTGQSGNPPWVNPKGNGDARMLEATSYGLIAVGLILVATFCFILVEERITLQANRSSSLVEESKMSPLRNAGAVPVSRLRTESVGREELTGLFLSIQMTYLAQARPTVPTESLLRERGREGVFHG